MLDYMCGLQAKFFHAPSFPDLEQEIATLHDELVQKMDREDRRRLRVEQVKPTSWRAHKRKPFVPCATA